MSQYILRNVSLNKEVEAFASEHFKIVSVDELTDDIAPQIEVLLTNGKGKAPKALLDRLPNLKMIDDFGVGYDGVDIEECKKRNIAVCTTPGVLTEDVADLMCFHKIGYILFRQMNFTYQCFHPAQNLRRLPL